MKKLILFAAIYFFSNSIMGQSGFNDSLSASRLRISRNAMTALGAWSVANITSGFILAGQTEGEAKYFWRMNGYWNIVNLGLAGMGYFGSRKAMGKKFSFTENVKAQHSVEKLYLLNLGLDAAYITGGFLLRERGNSRTDPKVRDQLKGYGSSLILQGGFLMIYDGIVYLLHRKNTRIVNEKLQQLEINAGPGIISFRYRF